MARADQSQLEELHDVMARVLKQQLEEPDPSASILNVARQFLNDNGIEVKPGTGSKTDELGKTVEGLPFPNQSDTATTETVKH